MSSPSRQKQASRNKDLFTNLPKPDYKYKQGSRFLKIFTDMNIPVSIQTCQNYWDRLRTRNFQYAGHWFTTMLYPEGEPKNVGGKKGVTGKKIEIELSRESAYLKEDLSDCKDLNPLQLAARWAKFIVEQEAGDVDSFIHDLRDQEQRITFVCKLFDLCEFNSSTYQKPLTKLLFPQTRYGKWRKKHLHTAETHTGKRNMEDALEDTEHSDSERGDPTISEDERAAVEPTTNMKTDKQQPNKRAKLRSQTPSNFYPAAYRDVPSTRRTSTTPANDPAVWDQATHKIEHVPAVGFGNKSTSPLVPSPSSIVLSVLHSPNGSPSPQAKLEIATAHLGRFAAPESHIARDGAPQESDFIARRKSRLDLNNPRSVESPSKTPWVSRQGNETNSGPTTTRSEISSQLNARIAELEVEAEEREATLQKSRHTTRVQLEEITTLEGKVSELQKIRKKNHNLADKDHIIAEKDRSMAEKEETIQEMEAQYNDTIHEKDQRLTELECEVSETGNIVAQLRTEAFHSMQENTDQDKHISELKEEIVGAKRTFQFQNRVALEASQRSFDLTALLRTITE